jgi:hypothetical protein
MKVCYKCSETKELTEFYKDRTRKDGLENRCKDCGKNRSISEASRVKANERKALYDKTTKGREVQKKSQSKYKNAHICRGRFNHEVREGRIRTSSSCEHCLSDKSIQAHHWDYNYPYEVMWLCRTCHSLWHKNNEPLNRKYGIFNPLTE